MREPWLSAADFEERRKENQLAALDNSINGLIMICKRYIPLAGLTEDIVEAGNLLNQALHHLMRERNLRAGTPNRAYMSPALLETSPPDGMLRLEP